MKNISELNEEIMKDVKDVFAIEHPEFSDLFLGSIDMPNTCNVYDINYKEDGSNTLSMNSKKIEIAENSLEGFFEKSINNKVKLSEKGKEYLDSVLLECSESVYENNLEFSIKYFKGEEINQEDIKLKKKNKNKNQPF